MSAKFIIVPPHLEDLREEVSMAPSGLARVPITTMLQSIDRLPEEKLQHGELKREAIESMLRPNDMIEPISSVQKGEELCDSQSFDSVSEMSSDEETKEKIGKSKKMKERRKTNVLKKNNEAVESAPSKYSPPPEKDEMASTLTVGEELRPNDAGQRIPPAIKFVVGEELQRADLAESTLFTSTNIQSESATNGDNNRNMAPLVSIANPEGLKGETLGMHPKMSSLTRPKTAAQCRTGVDVKEPATAEDKSAEKEVAETNAKNIPLLIRRCPNLSRTSATGTFHATSIIANEDAKADVNEMNMRSLENPTFLASLTLEQHEALQEKLQRRKKCPEERAYARSLLYVHPERRHLKEEMFLMRRHNLLQRQIQMPDYSHMDDVSTPQVHTVFSKADKQHLLNYLTRENSAKVFNEKLRRGDAGDLQHRVKSFVQKMEKFIKDNTVKEPHLTLAENL
jgi:hypothetical protein